MVMYPQPPPLPPLVMLNLELRMGNRFWAHSPISSKHKSY